MKRRIWLLLAVVPVLLAMYTLRRSPIPPRVSGGEVLPSSVVESPEPVATPVPIVPPAVPPTVAPPVAEAGLPEQEELRVVDAYATEERQKIEAWYSDELARLKTLLEERLQKLDGVDKLAWAQFYQRANETWSTTSGYDYGSAYDSGYGSAYGHGFRSETTDTFVRGDPAEEYAAIMAQIKDSKQATQEDFVKAQQKLAWMREQKLLGVRNEVDRRKAVIALKKSRAQMELERKLSGDRSPIVEAVITTADNRFCALVGDALVYEGNTVQGYRVRKIRADSVEFEKDEEVWVQKVN